MYVDTGRRLDPARTTRLAHLAERLDLRPGPEGYRATVLEPTRALFQPELCEEFPGRWTYCIVVALHPGRHLGCHRDGPIIGVRRHAVLATNERCWSFHDDHWARLDLGGIYVMDPDALHGAVNWGDTVRLHLVIDTAD